jgi:hypothetical protein
MVHDRAGDKLGKEHDEEHEIAKDIARRALAIHIHQIGDLLEREERQSERQDNAEVRQLECEQRVDVGDEKIRVFEHAEDREIEGDTQCEDCPARPVKEPPAKKEIHHRRGREQQQVERNEIPIKHDARRDQPQLRGIKQAASDQALERRQHDRQEAEGETEAAEQHVRGLLNPSAKRSASASNFLAELGADGQRRTRPRRVIPLEWDRLPPAFGSSRERTWEAGRRMTRRTSGKHGESMAEGRWCQVVPASSVIRPPIMAL